MRLPLNELGKAAMAGIDPEFYKKITKGDIIVAGKNFGSGSSRELAPLALKNAGVAAVVAEYFARIFLRNCIAIGFPIVECKNVHSKIDEGDMLRIHLATGEVDNLTKGETYVGTKFPTEFIEIFEAGGIIAWAKQHPTKFMK